MLRDRRFLGILELRSIGTIVCFPSRLQLFYYLIYPVLCLLSPISHLYILSFVLARSLSLSLSLARAPACAREIRFLLFREPGCVREVIGRRTSSSVATNFADDRQDRRASSPRTRNPIIPRRAVGGWGEGGSGGFTRRRLRRTKRDRAYLASRNIDHRRRFRLRYLAFATYGIRATSAGNSPFSLFLSLSLSLSLLPPKSVRALAALAWKNILIHPLPRGCALKRLTIQYFQKPISR